MSTVLFTRFPLESRFGGAEVQTLSLIKGLKNKGHEVYFLGSCPILLSALQEEYSTMRVQQLEIGPPPVTPWNAVSLLWRQIHMKKALIHMLCTTRSLPAVICMLSLSEKLLITDWCTKQGIKVIWIEHDRVGSWLRKNPWLPKLRRLSRTVTTVVVSDLSRDLYLNLGWDPMRTISIPNGISLKSRATHFDDAGLRRVMSGLRKKEYGNNFRIGCIARLSYDKGVDLLVQAVQNLPNVTLEALGEGPEEKQLNMILPAHATITPSVPDISTFLERIDCLVLPSREHDPFGLVIAEAMAAGIPTICTTACGIARHLDAEDSIIVPAGSSESLRSAIQKIQDPDIYERLSTRGPMVVKTKFSLERMVNAYDLLI